jgi:hypothetical protein
MIGYSSHSRSCKLDGFAYSRVGHAAANIPCHYCVDVAVIGVGIIFQQRGCLHDLPRLTVPVLRNLKLKPCRLQRMPALRIKPFDRRDLRGGDCAERVIQDLVARPSTCTVPELQKPIPQPNLVPVRPISSRITQSNGVSSGLCTETVRPLSSKVIMIA